MFMLSSLFQSIQDFSKTFVYSSRLAKIKNIRKIIHSFWNSQIKTKKYE